MGIGRAKASRDSIQWYGMPLVRQEITFRGELFIAGKTRVISTKMRVDDSVNLKIEGGFFFRMAEFNISNYPYSLYRVHDNLSVHVRLHE